MEERLAIALEAIRLYGSSHPRPRFVSHDCAAEMLGRSTATITRYIRAGVIKVNRANRIPMEEIDRMLEQKSNKKNSWVKISELFFLLKN